MLEQTIRDYTNPNIRDFTNGVPIWEEASDFIFDDEYRIQWGDIELSLENILTFLEIDIDWFRLRAKRKLWKNLRTVDKRHRRKK